MVSEGGVTIPESARCWGCGYPLRGLRSSRCPECGRAFELSDPGSYHTPEGAPAWGLWIARPPGRLMLRVYILWALAVVGVTSSPGNWGTSVDFQIWGVAIGLTALWLLHGFLSVVTHHVFYLPATSLPTILRRWAAWPTIALLVLGLVLGRVPLSVRFILSRTSLDRLAQQARTQPVAKLKDTWAGLFHVHDVSVVDKDVRVWVNEYVDWRAGGLTYSEAGLPKRDADRLWGDWYCWNWAALR